MTVRFLGEVATPEEETLRASLGDVTAGMSTLTATAGPRPRALGGVWVLPVAGLDHLAGAIEGATRDVGQPPPHRPYRGHLTLARARRPNLLRDLPEGAVAAVWTVTDVTLVRSHLGSGGARYDVIGEWALLKPELPA